MMKYGSTCYIIGGSIQAHKGAMTCHRYDSKNIQLSIALY
jgi:hypothetical protein